MSSSYITFAREGESRIEVTKSEFIGNAAPVSSAKEAEDFVAKIRAEYPDARHVCYAWRVSGETFMQKYSDDGEPSGTAGMPILNVLDKKEITNGVITVTRYFGGVLLGKGGLVRAYTDSAASAANEAGLVSLTEGEIYSMTVGYDMSEKLINALTRTGWDVKEPSYGENVTLEVTCPVEKGEELKAFVKDRSFGRTEAVKTGTDMIRVELDRN